MEGSLRYKLISTVPCDDPMRLILRNRGMTDSEIDEWMSGEAALNDPFLYRNMKRAVQLVNKVMKENGNIWVCVDSDVDGLTSAWTFINYLWCVNPQYVRAHVKWGFHEGKQHGLVDMMEKIPKGTRLVVCPDSASNDIEQHKALSDAGVSVLCLDHHQCDKESPYAVVVNAQIDSFPDKSLTGAGCTYMFCRAYDETYGLEFADDFIDLAAIGDIADMADFRVPEIRTIVALGLSDVRNPLMQAIVRYNEYSIGRMGGLNYTSVGWYVAPLLNALCRSGTMEEKERVFRAGLSRYADVMTESTKRGHRGERVPLADEAVLLLTRVRDRQTQMIDRAMADIGDLSENAHKIVVCQVSDDEVSGNVFGLVANKIQSMTGHPTLVVREQDGVLSGSARNVAHCDIPNMRSTLLGTHLFELCAGHESAFGVRLPAKNLDEVLRATDRIYADVSLGGTYQVDFEWSEPNVSAQTILAIARHRGWWGQQLERPLIAVKDVSLSSANVSFLSPDKHPTIKITLRNGVEVMKFRSSREEYESFISQNSVGTFVCTAASNEWNGSVRPQLIVEDFDVKHDTWIF